MTNHEQLIRELGGIRPVARALGHRNHTTVQGWWERKHIPDERIDSVLALAAASRTPAERQAA